MNLSFFRKHRFHVVVGAAALAMVLVAVVGDLAVASNMGFKMNKQLVRGTNYVALPFRGPLQHSRALCEAFGVLSGSLNAISVGVTQFNGVGPLAHTCNLATDGPALLLKGNGVRIIDARAQFPAPGPTSTGILVGAHIPSQAFTVLDDGPGNVGLHIYGYPYHTTNAFARDICLNGAFTATVVADSPALTFYGATGGVSGTHTCNLLTNGPALRLGEAVKILNETNGPKTFVPSHF
ncbi:MAG: hypothetical protein ACREAA_08705 [Candidatus Polarisedimenticolia bacterium]